MSTPPQALFVSYTSLLGGAERILLDHATALPGPVALACPDGPLAERARAAGIDVVNLQSRRVELRARVGDRLAMPLRMWAQGQEVRKIASELRPGCVVAWGMRPLLSCAAGLRGLRPRPPLVFQHNDLLPGPLIGRVVRAAARRADLTIVLSQAIADDLDPDHQLALEVVRPGVDLVHFHPAGDPSANRPTALLLGAIVDWKRPDLALEIVALAARELPDLRLKVAGAPLAEAGGELLADLKRRASQPDLAGRVDFAGQVADIPAALARSTCLLHCSDREPYGMALVEALACGRPVVAPAAAGPLEIVDASCGALYPPGDAQAAAAALVEVVGRATALGRAARTRAETRFDRATGRARFAELVGDVGRRHDRGRRRRADPVTAPIAINARAALRDEVGGVERVTRELVARLPALAPDRYRVVAPPAALAHRAGHAWEQIALPAVARGAELIFSPANAAPIAGRRNAVLIHDLAPLVEPSWYSTAYGAWHRALLRATARHARLAITPSEFVRSQLTELLGMPADRVVAVPMGVDPAFGAAPNPAPVLRRLGLDERPYVLAVGTAIARKNLGLIDTIAPTLAAAGLDAVIAGGTRGYMRDDRPATARRLGYVPETDLPALYAGAAAFALPSLYEGFGLPCLEAMAAGAPVVTTRRGALPETCADAALYADPEDPTAFADACIAAATDPTIRDRLTATGRARSAEFTWDQTAKRVNRALEALLPLP